VSIQLLVAIALLIAIGVIAAADGMRSPPER
jgi:hypothetical protein